MAGGRPWLLVALLVTTVMPAVHGRQPLASLPPDRFAAAVAAAAAIELRQRLVEESPTARAGTHTYPEATVVSLGEQPVSVIYAADIDPLHGEDLPGAAQAAAALTATILYGVMSAAGTAVGP
jgi:hypothetical protein